MKYFTIENHKVEGQAREKTVHVTEYESIEEFEKDLMAKEVSTLFKGPYKNRKFEDLSSVSGNASFTGTHSFNDALNLLRNGWEHGAKELTKKLKVKNNSPQMELVRKTVYDIVGFQACVPRYLQGVPQSMINKRMIPQKQKVLTLVKDICYSAGVSQERIMEDSITFLQIVQAIEAQGIRVNINAAFLSKEGNEWSWVRLKIKGANERINISKMAFAMAHPSFLRRMMFRYIETDERLQSKGFTRGYGVPGAYEEMSSILRDNEYMVKKFNSLETVVNDIKTLKKY